MTPSLTCKSAAAAFGLCLLAGMAHTSAEAADLPVYVPPPPAPVWSWAGPYLGLHVGAVDGDISARGEEDPEDFELKLDPNGIVGGVQAGYNFQFDSIVLGVEGDFSFGDVDDVAYPADFRFETQIDWMATIRGRVGWAMDRTLFYATGGAAFADMELKASEGPFTDKDTQTMFGWTVGGGVEHAFTDYLSFKAEYLYADFNKETFTLGGEDERGRADLQTHTFRVGVNWLF
ncbi:porin family protein [Kaustia mangrovi]|uniref:Porin family protein n=1 Tax=Kaustia mangrovi TaxID=2593653 RepID=A0A7S8HBG0_9HYPH|nr:outer membrane protein [Kaustia mangrovi]QPC42449.1 porin family protein [Kaustia mangrovi]